MSAHAGLLPHEQRMSIDDLVDRGDCTRTMIAEVKRFAAEPFGMLTLWGSWGNGKTAALAALVNHFNALCAGTAIYVRFADLLEAIREGFDERADVRAEARHRLLLAIPFLAIDEVDKAHMTEWAGQFRARFFDDRYRQARSGLAHTALALNFDPSGLAEHLYDRLRWGEDLQGGFRIVRNEDPSARPRGL